MWAEASGVGACGGLDVVWGRCNLGSLVYEEECVKLHGFEIYSGLLGIKVQRRQSIYAYQ